MSTAAMPTKSLPVLVVTPTGSDGSITERVLRKAGLQVLVCDDIKGACEQIKKGGAGALLLAEEALVGPVGDELVGALGDQPAWSDIPIVLLTGEGELSGSLPKQLSDVTIHGNVTLIERPVRITTLVTILRSALRARERQLDVRNNLVEREKLIEAERAARQEAEEANAAKSQFLATMSHELRTPLNAIAGYAQLLTLELRGPITEAQREDLERIERSQRHLLSLINDVLNFAKIEAGHIAVENNEVDISVVLKGLDEFVRPQLSEKNLTFDCDCPESEILACGDADKVLQILINLLSNAIKFTSEGGRIDLRCTAESEVIRITVKDTGMGIPPDKLEAVFEPFVQVNRGYATPQEGTGLGLSISRDLARRMGGDLVAESKVGTGSQFTLSLPRSR
ncbi:MAG: ATP-binding protein [Gemmatimonadota bacterium]|nr:ATP-binding protein [Gemmatimonadota bacterium]